MTTVPSVCPLDCPDRCSLAVTVEDGRVTAIDGAHENPLTEGYICGKVRKFGERVHGPLRLRQPAIRVGPKGPGATFRPVSWDEALDVVATRLLAIAAEHGWSAVLPYWYGGSNGWLTGGGIDERLWNRLGTSKVLRTLCASNTGAAQRNLYGDLPSADPLDVDHADLVLLWGVNPSASGIHLVPHLRALQARGGKLVVVDPRRTPLAKGADLHLAPLPGTDVVLALALAREAFVAGHADQAFLDRWVDDVDAYRAACEPWTPERAAEVTGVDAAAIRQLAAMYAATPRALIRAGWGLERTRNGTDAVRSVLALPAIYGRFGQRGSGWVLSTSGGYGIDTTKWAPPTARRAVNMSQIGTALDDVTDPPIRALFVYDCNPAVTVPDQERVLRGLARDDLFVVVHEQVHTDTCDYADVLLPATTFLEHREVVRSYGGYLVQWSEPAIPPVGEARSNHAVLTDLARRLGVGDGDLDVTEDALADEMMRSAGLDPQVMRRDRVVTLPRPVQFVDRVPSRRVALAGPLGVPRFRPPPSDGDRPLIVVSPATTAAISSTGYERLKAGTGAVTMNPGDAADRGIGAGDAVRLWNSFGEVVLRAELDDGVRRGVVSIPKGLWRSATLNGRTSNALIPPHVDEHGGGACYNDARVDAERVAAPVSATAPPA